jgi:bifunctional polynucleotide phosphatase/kinase
MDGKRATSVRARLALLATTLETPFQFYGATQMGANDAKHYRKGGTGMWEKMVADHNGGVKPDLKASFFVGDAAGRAGDHSAVDKEFAENVGIRFFVPEEIFVEGEAWR